MMDTNDIRLVQHFYDLLDKIETRIGGRRVIADCHGRMDWPIRGVYFFFEPEEERTTSGSGLRCVRVGTHAVRVGSKTSLWDRLRQHRGRLGGRNPGSGNHRASIFRGHVGDALIERDNWPENIAGKWGDKDGERPIRDAEVSLEKAVSQHIRSMPFIWLEVDDEPGPDSLRGCIERNSIALLSNYLRQSNPVDPPSSSWLGLWARSDKVRKSGLWNANHVDDMVDNQFLKVLESFI